MNIELETEEVELLKSILAGVPLQGSFVQMEKTINIIKALLEKLNQVPVDG